LPPRQRRAARPRLTTPRRKISGPNTKSCGAFISTPDRLPPPKTGPIVTDRALIVPYNGQRLDLPPGFAAAPFATVLANPRRLLVLANGDVLVAEQAVGYVTLLPDDGTGHAVWIDRHVEDLNKPYGLAWQADHLLIADQDGIWKVPHVPGALRPGRPTPLQRVADLAPDQRKPVPGAYGADLITKKGVFGIVQGHQNRDLKIDPKTGRCLSVSAWREISASNPSPRRRSSASTPTGRNQITWASGTRNPTALAFQPETGDLWAVVQERDWLGDNLPSDYLIRIRQGGFYGWPYAYIGKHPQPGFANLALAKVAATITPDLLFQAHSSLLDLVFYEGNQFPAQYKGQLFVALKGSWNRSLPTGYKIALVPFKDGKPEGYYQNFATGFWMSGERRAEVWGRPAALAVAKDGSLLIADDTAARSGAFPTPPITDPQPRRARRPCSIGSADPTTPARRGFPGWCRSGRGTRRYRFR
jgi:glucose/arabinose dehydrogenase